MYKTSQKRIRTTEVKDTRLALKTVSQARFTEGTHYGKQDKTLKELDTIAHNLKNTKKKVILRKKAS